eukprot:CAMPEP_0184866700 /NCGR_PEP_ID=MMETSP0580-20130426/23347_1 /TAXON_ID=1118495 /ORGANISM="Dactyliosolen fragilissimus" /LENGTH=179 /DNA_ID=CAMNT_0027366517 /DNA_START=169 /DNA_END=705 /DNA_ORIENTATION=+
MKPYTSSYQSSDSSTKQIVSSLTNFFNFFMNSDNDESLVSIDAKSPTSPTELMEILKNDYIKNNYLWTGNIYTPAFDQNCKFTDPTLSFSGLERFITNVQNLQPILDFLILENDDCRSDLVDISLNEKDGYIQTRWNMYGELNRLPWKPAIDVFGKTKFWYRYNDDVEGLQVYFYDEEW